jgi:hypothetical protein
MSITCPHVPLRHHLFHIPSFSGQAVETRLKLRPNVAISECATLTLLLIIAGMVPVFAQQTTFYFHDDSELTFSYPAFQVGSFQVAGIQANASSSSAQVFAAATSIAPTTGGITLGMHANISVSGSQSVYAAFVGWVTNPFPVNVTLDGNVAMHVWMSSSDTLGFFQGSEYFMGVADYSPSGSTQFQVLDDYLSNPVSGNIFSSTPTEYIANLTITQHQFQAGSMIVFFAGAGSNKPSYTFNVYFDNPTWQSRADIPADPTLTVPEFQNSILILLPAMLLPSVATKRRKI